VSRAALGDALVMRLADPAAGNWSAADDPVADPAALAADAVDHTALPAEAEAETEIHG